MKNKSIAAILQEYRTKYYTKEELAQYFGGDETMITDWEDGNQEPTISQCLVLCRLYGTTLDEMFADFNARFEVSPDSLDRYDYECKLNALVTRWYN